MSSNPLVERLAAHRTLQGVPPDQLAWLAAHGRLVRYDRGAVVTSRTGPVLGLFIILSGLLSIRVDRGAGPRRVMEWRGGDVTGLVPYSRLKAPPGDVVVEEPAEALLIEAPHLRELARECHELTEVLVHVMLDRARHFTSTDLHDEKMLSLGRLAAGLAHELNNPASALVRDAKELIERLNEMEAASRVLGAKLRPEQLALVDGVRDVCLSTLVSTVRSPVAQMDREDAFREWLSAHGGDPDVAEPLAETALTLGELDALAAGLDRGALDAALRSAAATCLVRRLATDMETAASRIHGLVSAVKGFTYMDQATVPAPVDVARGLADTLAVLKSKARAKSVEIRLETEPDLPAVDGFGGELNQVWVNLIDNALDAAPREGRVDVQAGRSESFLVVRVVDNGPGIPDPIKERIFEPFFTTKPVGQGTGLGLDLVRRLVHRNEGTIDVESRPGRTEFRVTLPLSAPPPAS